MPCFLKQEVIGQANNQLEKENQNIINKTSNYTSQLSFITTQILIKKTRHFFLEM